MIFLLLTAQKVQAGMYARHVTMLVILNFAWNIAMITQANQQVIPSGMRVKLRKLLVQHEDERKFAYLDTLKNITAGVGHNLSANPIAQDIIDRWFNEDVDYIYQQYLTNFTWFSKLNDARQIALIDLGFMGFQKVLEFKKMLKALSEGDFDRAAREIMLSTYANQVGQRAYDLANIIGTGNL